MRANMSEARPTLWQLDTVDTLISQMSTEGLNWMMMTDLDFWLATYGRVHDLITTLEEKHF